MPKDDFLRLLSEQVDEGRKLLKSPRRFQDEVDQAIHRYFAWEDYNKALLNKAFESSGGWLTVTPASEYQTIGLPVADLHISRTKGVPAERQGDVDADVAEKCRYLEALAGRVDLYISGHDAAKVPTPSGDAIFLVHGHNYLLREKVRRFLEGLTGRTVIVLDEQPNQGRDILGKLLEKAYEAAFAVVLMTGDDEGRAVAAATTPNLRARQNVILELGLFLGLLGRSKVVALYQDGVEIPSDYSGILYTKIDDGGWQLKIAQELKAAGIDVDMNRLI
jgi:predicted nucleotide-binding protein